MSDRKRHANEFLRTVTGRLAGDGIISDDYSEESFPDFNPFNNTSNSFWHRPIKIELGEVKRYKLSDEELKKYRGD